jgi:hypothetical protein
MATLPSFSFQELLKKSTELAQAAEYDASGLFSLSPLSSPEPSRPPSPAPPLPSDLFPPPPPSLSESLFPQIPTSSSTSIPPPIHDPLPHPTRSVMPTIAADRLKRKKAQGHASRSKRRAKAKESRFSPYESRPGTRAKYIDSAASINIPASLGASHVTSTAYIALNPGTTPPRAYRLDEAVGPTSTLGFTLQEWDGALSPSLHPSRFLTDSLPRTTMPVLDSEGRLVAILAGHPDDECWPDLSREAAEMLEKAGKECIIPAKGRDHRRGNFSGLATGISHGGGQKSPRSLRNTPHNADILDKLNQQPPFLRNSGFATSKHCMRWQTFTDIYLLVPQAY